MDTYTVEKLAAALADDLRRGGPGDVPMAGGFAVLARFEYDPYLGWEDATDPEVVGRIAEPVRCPLYGRYRRPSSFDGAARKLRSRSGELWWQPPSAVKGNPDALESAYQYAAGYFDESWSFASLDVQVTRYGQEIGSASLGAVESEADGDYLADLLLDMLPEAGAPGACRVANLIDAHPGLEWLVVA